MLNKGKRNNFERIFFNQKVLTLIGLAAIILISFPFAKNTIKQRKINKEIDDFKKEITALDNKNLGLKSLVSYWESDQAVEEQARRNLNLKKSGEELVVIKNDILVSKSASPSENTSIFNRPARKKAEFQPARSNPEKWFIYFFK